MMKTALAMGALLGALISGSASAASCVLTMRWTDDPPYTMAPDQQHVEGIHADIIREAMRRQGCSIEFVKLPWARALAELKEGRVQIITGAYRTPEREAFAHYAASYLSSPNVLFVRAGDVPFIPAQKLSDLEGRDIRLGVLIGVVYSQEYRLLLEQESFKRLLSFQTEHSSLWKMLDAKRVDGVLADEMTGRFEARELGYGGRFVRHPMTISNDESYPIFSKASVDAAFVERFNETIVAMRQDGTIARVLLAYADIRSTAQLQ